MSLLVIFDGDDTLWLTESLYDEARQDARRIVEAHGLDGARWEAAERSRDVANVGLLGHSRHRFPTSCVEALSDLGDGELPPNLAMQVWDAATRVFAAAAPVAIHAPAVLEGLSHEHCLALLTKGDPEVQAKRVRSSGLDHYFATVRIVSEKDSETFLSLSEELGVLPERTVSVGNSIASDIIPAVEVGMHGIWIDAYVWEYERRRSDRAVVPANVSIAHTLDDLPGLLKDLDSCL